MGTEIEVPPLALWVQALQNGTVPLHTLVQWNVSPRTAALLRHRRDEAAFVLLTGQAQRDEEIILKRKLRRAFELPTTRRSMRIALRPTDNVIILMAVSGLGMKASRNRLTSLIKSPMQMSIEWDALGRTFRLRPLSYEFYPIEEASATLVIRPPS